MKLDVEMRMFINHTHLKIISKNKNSHKNIFNFVFVFSF